MVYKMSFVTRANLELFIEKNWEMWPSLHKRDIDQELIFEISFFFLQARAKASLN